MSVWPPMSPETGVAGVRPAASLYAVVRSVWAVAAVPSATCVVPSTVPGGNPLTMLPGLNARSMLTTVGPVLVTSCPARTEKSAAVPRSTGACAARA